MVRMIRTMYETTRTGPGVLSGWLAVWLVSLALLASMPGTGAACAGNGGTGVYYDYGSAAYQYQDPSGAYTVPARTLRPIFNG